ncbi:MAG: restriction endonuclease subunit S [Chloroflexota bacterium]
MMEGLQRYHEYKPSGLPWVGMIPSHWTLERLDRLFTLRNEQPQPGDERVTGYLDGRVTLRSNMAGQKIKGVVKEAGWQRVHPGDFAISGMNAHLGGMGVSDSLGKCSPIYLVLRPKVGTNARFVSYAVRYAAHRGALKALVQTIRFNSADLKRDDLKRIWLWLPTSGEQVAIVRFLDYMSRRIRSHLRSKQKLVTLLNEQKQAIVQRAVTRGIEGHGATQELGSTPPFVVNEHWTILRIANVAHVRTEKNRPELDLLSVFLDRGVIQYSDGGGQVHKPSLDLTNYQVVHPGDLVLNNQQAWRGSVGVSKYEGIISPAYFVLVLSPTLFAPFADYLFRSQVMVSQFLTSSKGVGDIQRDVYFPWLKSAKVPVPPVEEQRSIAAFLDSELASVDAQISRHSREISLLQEYRDSLTSDVITGRLDVREAASELEEGIAGEPDEGFDAQADDDPSDIEMDEEDADPEEAKA